MYKSSARFNQRGIETNKRNIHETKDFRLDEKLSPKPILKRSTIKEESSLTEIGALLDSTLPKGFIKGHPKSAKKVNKPKHKTPNVRAYTPRKKSKKYPKRKPSANYIPGSPVMGEGRAIDFNACAKPSYSQRNANKNRKNPTDAESAMFLLLNEFPFRNELQVQWASMNKWILDFYIPSLKIGIEVDGSIHERELQAKKDKKKEEDLKRVDGITVIRFTNNQVLHQKEFVRNSIQSLLAPKVVNNEVAETKSGQKSFSSFDEAHRFFKGISTSLKPVLKRSPSSGFLVTW